MQNYYAILKDIILIYKDMKTNNYRHAVFEIIYIYID